MPSAKEKRKIQKLQTFEDVSKKLGRESKQIFKTSIEINCDYQAKLLGRKTFKNWMWQMNKLHFEQLRAGRASN